MYSHIWFGIMCGCVCDCICLIISENIEQLQLKNKMQTLFNISFAIQINQRLRHLLQIVQTIMITMTMN